MHNKRALFFIFITILIDCIGLSIIVPTLPYLIKELSGLNTSEAASYGGWLNFSYAIMLFIFSPVLGGLSDRYGRRPVLLLSLFGLGIDYVFLSFAPTITLLFVGRIIAGVCGASFTTATAYIADVSDDTNRAKNFGLIGAAFGIGFIIGPFIGSVFGQMGTKVPFMAAAVLSFLNFLFGYFALPESLKPENRRAFDIFRANPFGVFRQLGKHKAFLSLIVALFFLNLAGQAMPSIWAFFCVERFNWSQASIGYSLTFVGITVAAVQGGLIGVITRKLGLRNSIFVGLSCYLIGFLLFAFANQPWMMYAFMIPYAFGGLSVPNIQSYLTSRVGANEQGELQGGITGLTGISMVLGPLVMTGSFTHFTKTPEQLYFPGAPFLIGGVLTLISLIISYFVFRRNSDNG